MIANRKILIVDDEHPIADTLAAILQTNGFDVYVAYSGKRAIELALQLSPTCWFQICSPPRGNPDMGKYWQNRYIQPICW